MKLEENEPRRFCRKCLLRDLGKDEYFRNLKDYIRNLDPELKVPEDVYEKRLERCRECGELSQGLCRVCGCFVELRAVMKKNACPLAKPAWESEGAGDGGIFSAGDPAH